MQPKNLPLTRQMLAGTVRGPLPLRRLRFAFWAIAALTGLTVSAPAQNPLQTDNFDTGALTGWATSVCSNYPADLTFVTDVFGGKALRIAATNSALTDAALQNTSRAMIWMTNQFYTNNFYIAVDLVDWNPSSNTSTNEAVIGLIAHATNVVQDPSVPLGRPDGVILASHYEADGGDDGSGVNGTRGQLQIYAISDGQVPGPLGAGAQGDYTINPGHKYRLVFTGTNQFDSDGVTSTNFIYYGRIYDLEDLTRPLATIFANEPYYPAFHIQGYWSPSGYSGIFAIGYDTRLATDNPPWNPKSCDLTVDNFVAATDPPASPASFPATPHGLAGVPQVVNRQPVSYSNFYAAAGGITFNATTLSTTNTISTNGIHLFINGLDVTSSLVVTNQATTNQSVSATNWSVSFYGLTSNAVYDARIELADALGRKTTNAWTFDTFSDAYLASANCKNIECEDFDFDGQFVDNPVVSGYTLATTLYNNENVVAWPWAGAINQGPNSYVLQGGVNANGNGGVGDFFDYDSKNRLLEADYRPVGSIGTEQGSGDFLYYKFGVGQSAWVNFDTQRQKYSSVDPDLQEYNVERTEGGEWQNFTRTFYGTNYYNVYLRHGCELSQQLSLDVIGAGPTTNNLGTFYVTNALAKSNYRYAPLLNSSNNLAVVNLSEVNTLRLTVAVPQVEKYKQGLMLNYMAFVPALLVESSSQADTGYAIDTTASVEPGTRIITIPQRVGVRFYRLFWDHAVRITSVTLAGGNVLLTYQ